MYMNKWRYLFLFIVLWTIQAREVTARQWVTYSKSDSALVVKMLTAAANLKEQPDSWNLYFARQFINTPYIGGTLDRASEEKLVVNLTELDCTTFVEQVLALSLCAASKSVSFQDFCEALRHIRYIDGEVSYVKRQHYFSIWITDNEKEGLVKEIQAPKPPFNATQEVSVNWMSTHVSDYKMLTKHPEWKKGISALEKETSGKRYAYISKAAVSNTSLLRNTIHDGDIIAIVTNKQGLDIAHIGFAVWRSDGLHLLNASSLHKHVVDETMTLRQYLMKARSRLGIRIIRCLEPSLP